MDPEDMDPSLSSSPQIADSDDDEVMRMRYFEALRR